jgi:hypothetical protein
MGILLIRCPYTRRPISTGVEIEQQQLLALPDSLSYVTCPECGLSHAWWTREAWLEDVVEVKAPGEQAA